MELNIHVSKLNESVTFTNLPESSTAYLMQYGATQSVNDAHAAVQRKAYKAGAEGDAEFEAEVRKRVNARIEQIRTGNVPNLRGPAPITTAAAIAHLAKSTGMTVDQVAQLLKAVPAPAEKGKK